MKKQEFITALRKIAEAIDGLLEENKKLQEKVASLEPQADFNKRIETGYEEANPFFEEQKTIPLEPEANDWAQGIGDISSGTDPEQRLLNAIITGQFQ